MPMRSLEKARLEKAGAKKSHTPPVRPIERTCPAQTSDESNQLGSSRSPTRQPPANRKRVELIKDRYQTSQHPSLGGSYPRERAIGVRSPGTSPKLGLPDNVVAGFGQTG